MSETLETDMISFRKLAVMDFKMITLRDLALLEVLKEEGSSRPSLVSCRLGVVHGAVNAITNKLEAKGLVRRCDCAEDHRCTMIEITALGEATLQKARHAATQRKGGA
jgi:DNA-binding MarR family transcriptional regulator